MELESSNLINVSHKKTEQYSPTISFDKDLKKLTFFLKSIMEYINLFLIIISLIYFILLRFPPFIFSYAFNFEKKEIKELYYYNDIQHHFCDNIRNLYDKAIENKIFLYNCSLNGTTFDMFIYKNNDYLSRQIQLNQSYDPEGSLHMLNAIKYYADKYDYENDDILIIDIGSNVGWYTSFFGAFKYSVLAFEPLPDNYYVLKKNFCRNHKDFFGPLSTVTIVNQALYPKETFCDYYKDIKNSKKDLILCDKDKEKNLDKDYINIGRIKTTKLSDFIPLIYGKRKTLLRLDLESEGEMAIESGKELISLYHIPYVFIEFNLSMFDLHETKPKDFLIFFTDNGYKISIDGFLTKKFISIEDLLKIKFTKINLYLVYVEN